MGAGMQAGTRKPPSPEPPPPRVWTSLDLIKWTAGYFLKKGLASPRLEAELLLAEVLNCPRIKLYADFERPVPAEKLAKYREFVKRRGDLREPSQYILGYAQFIDLRLKVTPAVLIPRPETEILALWAVERLLTAGPQARSTAFQAVEVHGQDACGTEGESGGREESSQPGQIENRKSKIENPRVLDLGTGSGCLALYIASKVAHAAVIATDISPAALAVAEENARALNLAQRVAFRQGSLFGALRPEEQASFDLLVANPPYVDPAEAATLAPEVREHEPREALYAAGGGLDVVRAIVAEAAAWLRPGGWLGMELGLGQAENVRQLAQARGVFQSVEIAADGAKLPRYLHAQRRG